MTGCGKSTIGNFLAEEEKCVFLEEDDFHPQANEDKIKAGCPLTDEDRAGWLESLLNASIKALLSHSLVIVVCSALKKKYRDVFREAVQKHNHTCISENATTNDSRIKLEFFFLSIDQDKTFCLVEPRAREKGHFMPPGLVPSQYADLDPSSEQELDCHLLDANLDLEEVETYALKVLENILDEA